MSDDNVVNEPAKRFDLFTDADGDRLLNLFGQANEAWVGGKEVWPVLCISFAKNDCFEFAEEGLKLIKPELPVEDRLSTIAFPVEAEAIENTPDFFLEHIRKLALEQAKNNSFPFAITITFAGYAARFQDNEEVDKWVGRIDEHPDRVEVAVIAVQLFDGRIYRSQFETLRGDDGLISEFKPWMEDYKFGGSRFLDTFWEAYLGALAARFKQEADANLSKDSNVIDFPSNDDQEAAA